MSKKSLRIREFDDIIVVNDNEICRKERSVNLTTTSSLNKEKEMFFVLVSGILMGYFCIGVRFDQLVESHGGSLIFSIFIWRHFCPEINL